MRAAFTTAFVMSIALYAGCSGEGPGTEITGVGGNGGGGGQAPGLCDPIGVALPAGNAPIERGDMAYAADPECQRIFMFSGDKAVPVMCGPAASDFLPDIHVYDLSRDEWSELQVQGPGPLPRARSRGAWDENSGRFLVFGGRHRDGTVGPYTFLNDLWAFDPATLTWEELSPLGAPGAPEGRMNTTFVVDPERNRVLVTSGGQITPDFSAFVVDNSTWAFDLETRVWSQIGNGGPLPPKRIFHMSALDRAGGRLFVFGGGGEDAFTALSFFDDTWYLDFATDTWMELNSAVVPEGRIKGEMIYDEPRNRLVLFAGHDDTQLGNNNDIWTLDLGSLQWERQVEGDVFANPALGFCDFPSNFATIDPNSPERRESHLFEVAGDTALMYGGRTDCGLSRDTWKLDLTTLTWEQLTESFVGMTCYRSGSLQCDDPGAKMCI